MANCVLIDACIPVCGFKYIEGVKDHREYFRDPGQMQELYNDGLRYLGPDGELSLDDAIFAPSLTLDLLGQPVAGGDPVRPLPIGVTPPPPPPERKGKGHGKGKKSEPKEVLRHVDEFAYREGAYEEYPRPLETAESGGDPVTHPAELSLPNPWRVSCFRCGRLWPLGMQVCPVPSCMSSMTMKALADEVRLSSGVEYGIGKDQAPGGKRRERLIHYYGLPEDTKVEGASFQPSKRHKGGRDSVAYKAKAKAKAEAKAKAAGDYPALPPGFGWTVDGDRVPVMKWRDARKIHKRAVGQGYPGGHCDRFDRDDTYRAQSQAAGRGRTLWVQMQETSSTGALLDPTAVDGDFAFLALAERDNADEAAAE